MSNELVQLEKCWHLHLVPIEGQEDEYYCCQCGVRGYPDWDEVFSPSETVDKDV